MSQPYPMPARFANKFEWAASFVQEHGMTLPPNTPELSSLRNWMCFKLNQFKKGTLGEDSIQMLEHYGLDFSRYEATNTGKGHRRPDAEVINALLAWRERTGSLDLSADAPEDLVRAHRLQTDTFSARGLTDRARKIEAEVPGLRIPLWRRHGQAPLTSADLKWWAAAYEYADLTRDTPAFLGVVHPDAPLAAAQWALQQLDHADQLTGLKRGFMVGQGLLVNRAGRERSKRREADLWVSRGVSLDEPEYGVKDRRLDSFLGICMYARMLETKANDKEVMAAFGINPSGLALLKANVAPLFQGIPLKTLQRVRLFYPDYGDQLLRFKAQDPVADLVANRPAALKPIHMRCLAAIAEALAYTRTNYIRQDIAVY